MSCHDWMDRHPIFMRLYVPVIVTATFAAQLWEMSR